MAAIILSVRSLCWTIFVLFQDSKMTVEISFSEGLRSDVTEISLPVTAVTPLLSVSVSVSVSLSNVVYFPLLLPLCWSAGNGLSVT